MRYLLKTDGTEVHFDEPKTLLEICELIGAEVTDTVLMRHLGTPLHVMVVDDNGWETEMLTIDDGGVSYTELVPVRPLKPINEMATILYTCNCLPGTAHQITGDVFIAPDGDFA